MAEKVSIDMAKAQKTAEHVFGMLGGALASAMIYLGDRLVLDQRVDRHRAGSDSGAAADHDDARGILRDQRGDVAEQSGAPLFRLGKFPLQEPDQPVVLRLPRRGKPGLRMSDFAVKRFQFEPIR